jgi:hypothetical protein
VGTGTPHAQAGLVLCVLLAEGYGGLYVDVLIPAIELLLTGALATQFDNPS